MRTGVAFCWLPFLLSSPSLAVKLTIKRPSQQPQVQAPQGQAPKVSNPANNNLINKNNLRYTANITIAGVEVNVALDTGSTDLWVFPPGGIAPTAFKDTGLTANLTYGDGSDFVFGGIGTGEFKLGDVDIPAQAFVNVQVAAAAEQADFSQGIFGLWGLGFNTPGSSRINDAVQQRFGATSTTGQSVLANIFAQHPTGSDYIGIALSRTGDQEGTADASLTIAEYDSDYQAVANAPKIPQNPLNSGAWTVNLDGLSINGRKIPWQSTVQAAPPGKTIAHLDTGTTNILMPAAQVNALYSQIPGAVLATNPFIFNVQFSTTSKVWVVPCNATPSVVATFNGQDFPVHPLDVTDLHVLQSPKGQNFTVCTGAFTDIGTIDGGRSDALFGDSFLRNVYTVFDFGTGGNTKGNPFVQMLSVTDGTKDAADLINVRLDAMADMPIEVPPSDLVAIFEGRLAPPPPSAKNPRPPATASATNPQATGSSGGSGPTGTGSDPGTDGSNNGNSNNGNSNPTDQKKAAATTLASSLSVSLLLGASLLVVIGSAF